VPAGFYRGESELEYHRAPSPPGRSESLSTISKGTAKLPVAREQFDSDCQPHHKFGQSADARPEVVTTGTLPHSNPHLDAVSALGAADDFKGPSKGIPA